MTAADFRKLALGLLISAHTTASPIQAQSDSASRQEVQDLRRELAARLTPFEARLLERVDTLEQQLIRDEPWRDPKVFVPLLAAVIGWTFAIYQLVATRRQRTWELLLESLGWFEGGTQKRSIGIAVIETKWDHQKEFRTRWVSILVNQAIYLLTREKDRDARHERANLYRIMNLLAMHHVYIQDFERSLLAETLKEYSPEDRGLTGIDATRLETWRRCFPS